MEMMIWRDKKSLSRKILKLNIGNDKKNWPAGSHFGEDATNFQNSLYIALLCIIMQYIFKEKVLNR